MSHIESARNCIFCSAKMKTGSESYTLREIFEWWKDASVHFSDATQTAFPLSAQTTLFNCPGCLFGIFLPLYEGTDNFYSELSRDAASWYYLPNKWEYDRALQDVAGASLVLDVGCGEGFFLRKLRERNISGRGIELNGVAAAKARDSGLRVDEVSLKTLATSANGSFDFVTMFQVLEHVPDPLESLSAAKDCLAPGGRLLISVPNADGMFRWMGPLVVNVPPHHLTRWATPTFKSAAARLGMKLERIEYEPFWHYGMVGDAVEYHVREALRLKPRRAQNWLRFLIASLLRIPLGVLYRMAPKGLPFVRGHSIYVVLEK